jgi:sugar lactone lactonase YvrE
MKAGVVFKAIAAWAIGATLLDPSLGLRADSLRTALEGSALPVSEDALAAGRKGAFIARTQLSADELAETLTVEIALRLRNPGALQARIDAGETVARAEIERTHLPLATDHARVLKWIQEQGLAVEPNAGGTLSIFAQGSVADMIRVFGVRFARVNARGRQTTSAVTAPSVPTELSNLLLGINGLQPHLAPARAFRATTDGASSPAAPYSPSQLLEIYNGASPGATGTGQTIAIVIDGYPSVSDANLFWTTTGITRNGALTLVPVGSGPSAGTSQEADMDVEWSGAVAPGASIRVYGMPDLTLTSIDQACSQILADAQTVAGLSQMSMSFTYSNEKDTTPAQLQTAQQWFAVLAASGISLFASSGDAGSQPGEILNGVRVNDPSLPSDVEYPASDPNVTAVGGTSVAIASNGSVASESAWSAGGGGVSSFFSRPAWQAGAGLPQYARRLVPDVSFDGDPNTGALIVYSGSEVGYGGTSLGSPVWAGICALANQARSVANLPPAGSFASRVYPLMGTSAFWDVTTGSNGVYQAGPGFDLCTGLGVPNIKNLVAALSGANAAAGSPTLVSRPGGVQTTLGGSASLVAEASGTAPLSYSWQRLPVGGDAWIGIVDNGAYSGTGRATLTVASVGSSASGDQFRCVISNAAGSVTTAPMAVVAGAPAVTTTVAGFNDAAGHADGVGPYAQFSGPAGVVSDASGNLYLADCYNNTIRKVSSSGAVSTVAGIPGVVGWTDGAAPSATFNSPYHVAVDSSGTLYVADLGNDIIRKISSSGIVSTLAGSPLAAGSADGTGSAARFRSPHGVLLDLQGNLIVSDTGNHTIRKVTPAGVVTTIAGSAGVAGSNDGIGSAARFNGPRGIAIDAAGNLYVADSGNKAVRKITPAGAVTTIAGSSASSGSQTGSGSLVSMVFPTSVAVDSTGDIYIADCYANCVLVSTPSGVVSCVAGLPESVGTSNGAGSGARFYEPWGIALDSAGNAYVTDSANNTVRKIVLPARFVTAPQSQTVSTGASVTFTTSAAGSALTYQWELNGVPIAGATTPTLTLAKVATSNAGVYTLVAKNAAGSAVSTAATLSLVSAGASTTRLVNLSSLSSVGAGNGDLIVGFSIGSGSKSMLIRAIGPSLAAMGVSGALLAPELALYDGSGAQIDLNEAWGGGAALAQLFSQVGAFALPAASNDTALSETLDAGGYTAHVSGQADGTGVALAELYDADLGSPPARLLNFSARGNVSAVTGFLVAGFSVSGTGTEKVLIRGIGPALASLGISGSLPSLRLTLYDSTGTLISSNSLWGGSAALSEAFGQAGAFALPSNSADAALIAILPAGSYTAQVSGMDGAGGMALVEVYELPPN